MAVVLHSNRAEALLQLGKHDKALEACEAALALDPSHMKSQQRKQRAEAARTKAQIRAKRSQKAKKAQAREPDMEEFFTPGYLELAKQGR